MKYVKLFSEKRYLFSRICVHFHKLCIYKLSWIGIEIQSAVLFIQDYVCAIYKALFKHLLGLFNENKSLFCMRARMCLNVYFISNIYISGEAR